jgi:hypothetical protein
MGVKTRKAGGQSIEQTVSKLRSTIDSIKNNITIHRHSMAKAVQELNTNYNIESIEAGIEMVGQIDIELQAREEELEKLTQEISVALETYSG